MKQFFYAAAFFLFPVVLSAQCGPDFYDGFETGTYAPTWSTGPSIAGTVNTTNPAMGTYCLEGTGGNLTHLNGFNTTITPATPTEISWWIYTDNNTSASLNYFVAGNGSISATNCIVFSYFQGSAGNIRFVAGVSYDHPATLNTWYHLEMRNINWTNHTYDIYINNTLVYATFPFRSSSQNDISRIHLYNYNSGTSLWDDIRIGSNDTITAADLITNVTCNGATTGAVDLTVTGGTAPYTFAWNNSATTEDISGIAAGTYSVTITDNLGCTNTGTFTVTEPSAITLSVTATNVTCYGDSTGSADITAAGGTPGYTYLWAPSGGTGATESGLMAGTYTCTVTDANGCTNTGPVTITEPPAIVATSSVTNVSCNGNTDGTALISVSGGSPGYTYAWSNGDTLVTADSLSPGNYNCTVTDMNGCLRVHTVAITEPFPLVITFSATNVTTCGGSDGTIDATVTGGTAPYTFMWMPSGANTEDVNGLAAGSYTLTVTDTQGCGAMNNVDLFDPIPPVVTLSLPTNFICLDDIDLALSGESPAGGTWSGPGVTGSAFDPSTAGVGMHPIVYTYTDASNCTSTATDSVAVDACMNIAEANASSWNVSPNPNDGTFTLASTAGGSEVLIEVMDVQGRIVFSAKETNVTPGFTRLIQLDNVATGIYMLRVSNVQNATSEMIRISVQR
jgi:hypothetical protein